MRRYIADAPALSRPSEERRQFVAVAALFATGAATLGVSPLALEGAVPWPEFVQNWWTWWHGDTAGIIIVTPLVLNWKLRYNIVWSPAKKLEAAGFAISLLLTAYLVFGNGTRQFSSLPLTFLILPLIIWAAFRFSRREVTTAGAVVCSIAVWYTVEQGARSPRTTQPVAGVCLLAFSSTIVATA